MTRPSNKLLLSYAEAWRWPYLITITVVKRMINYKWFSSLRRMSAWSNSRVNHKRNLLNGLYLLICIILSWVPYLKLFHSTITPLPCQVSNRKTKQNKRSNKRLFSCSNSSALNSKNSISHWDLRTMKKWTNDALLRYAGLMWSLFVIRHVNIDWFVTRILIKNRYWEDTCHD